MNGEAAQLTKKIEEQLPDSSFYFEANEQDRSAYSGDVRASLRPPPGPNVS
jgi:hypothetical protein